MCAIIRIGGAHLWHVVDDNTIHATLHWAYQVVFHLATIDRLVENQDVNLASSEGVICDGT